MDRELVAEKLESLRHCVERIEERCPVQLDVLEESLDHQDIVALNLTRAVQLSVDIAAHFIASHSMPPPQTMGEAFLQLQTGGILDQALSERMRKAVGFRNIAVHNYEVINWRIVHQICRHHLSDFKDFAQLFSKMLNAGNGSA
ncbi:MAG: DUF86 domain-containing protein [Gammaproteobacteria bacterium]|jgi:uncharacterized protein YutE (UPF0331/DUF86 family)|nr:DUF86 domain-containing protein [Gammaproteobacteria bacterium]MBT3490309.1 DUF86 domain-containing protein [Gammaproteobacteria bacterium]MBT3719890.1 DUF86 domain-containing protein [Gammaproteobacteria bacterium]MBT3844961.1 DUF86 domain-containing protein [Gammaproteobacteria bacterium]MBT3893962.1 DUF86 domain-containing protein [Gammaproteobacteria bacterium]